MSDVLGQVPPSTQQALTQRPRRRGASAPWPAPLGTPDTGQPSFGSTFAENLSNEMVPYEQLQPFERAFMSSPLGGLVTGMDILRATGQSLSSATDTVQPPLSPQAEMPFSTAVRDNVLASAQAQLQQVTTQFKLYQTLDGENLSPEARAEVNQLREDTKRQVTEINDQINRYMRGQDSFNRLTEGHADIMDSAIQSGRAAVNASRSDTQQNIATIRGEGLSQVEAATGRAMDAAVQALPEVQAQDAYYTYVRGGTEATSERARQEAEATASMGEIDNLISQNMELNASTQSQIADATARAANAQLDLMGITDKQDRLMTATALDNSLRQSVYNLVQTRQDLERESARNIDAIEKEDRIRNEDQYGLNINATPAGMWEETLAREIDREATALGIQMNPAQASVFADDVAIFESTVAGSPDRQLIIDKWARLLAKDPAAIANMFNRSSTRANRVFQAATNIGDQDQFEAGSPGMAALIVQSGGAEIPSEVAALFANSPSFHQLIATRSRGRVGAQRGGNMLGIGGLPAETYEAMGIDYESIRGDAIAEMNAFMQYVYTAYGDPAYALQNMTEGGNFGYLTEDRYSSSESNNAPAGHRTSGRSPTNG